MFVITIQSIKGLLDLILNLFFYCYAVGVPGTWLSSWWLECLTPKLHASLFSGPMLSRLHIFISPLTLRPGLFRSPSSSGARNSHTCEEVCA